MELLQGIVADAHFGAESEPFWQRFSRVIRNSTKLIAALLFFRFTLFFSYFFPSFFKFCFCFLLLFAHFAHFVGVSWASLLFIFFTPLLTCLTLALPCVVGLPCSSATLLIPCRVQIYVCGVCQGEKECQYFI